MHALTFLDKFTLPFHVIWVMSKVPRGQTAHHCFHPGEVNSTCLPFVLQLWSQLASVNGRYACSTSLGPFDKPDVVIR